MLDYWYVLSYLAAFSACGNISTEYTNLYIRITYYNNKCIQICALIACAISQQKQQQKQE
jgi:hypothetical protein